MICLRGPKITSGYWRDPAKTAASFFGDWFRTGDVGYLDDEVFLYLTDRKKDMIISGGENIASSEVERVLYQLPQVSEAAVVGLPDERWGERVAAHSAGLAPTGRVAEGSLAALRALGHPAGGLASKGLDAVPLDGLDVVVSLVGPLGLAALPTGRALRREAWSIPDPYGADEATYLAVARSIEERVRVLLGELLGPEPPAG